MGRTPGFYSVLGLPLPKSAICFNFTLTQGLGTRGEYSQIFARREFVCVLAQFLIESVLLWKLVRGPSTVYVFLSIPIF